MYVWMTTYIFTVNIYYIFPLHINYKVIIYIYNAQYIYYKIISSQVYLCAYIDYRYIHINTDIHDI